MAGVAAGSLLFNGVESLFNHPVGGYGAGSWGGAGSAGFSPEPRTEENITNNYYGDTNNAAPAAPDPTDTGFDSSMNDDSQGFDDGTSV